LYLTLAQAIRKNKLQKPDLILRKFPIVKVLEALKSINTCIALHPVEGWEKPARIACFCGKKSNGQMTKCATCDEWSHHKCTGMTDAAARQVDAWKCGYCIGEPDEDGNCKWNLPIPVPTRGAAPVAPLRNIVDTPKVKGLDTDSVTKLTSWGDVAEFCRKSGRDLNLVMMKNRVKAAKLVKEAGHHVGDEMSGGGLAVRAVDDRLVDEFLADGIMESGDDDDDE
jgi:hypothetical protein